MALDMHRKDNHEWLFSIDEDTFSLLKPVFKLFYQKTGLQFDFYNNIHLSVGHQKILIHLINENNIANDQILIFKNIVENTILNDINVSLYCD